MDFTDLLKTELVNACGCTEPIAIALAAAEARSILGAMPSRMEIRCSGNIIKNVKSVTVPNTDGMKGVESAAIIGVVAGDASKQLEVLSNVKIEDIKTAKELLKKNFATVELKEGEENLDIEIEVFDEENNSVIVEIKNKHTNIVKIVKNGEIVQYDNCYNHVLSHKDSDKLSIANIFDYAHNVDITKISDILEKQIVNNSAIAEEGLKGNWGSAVGHMLLEENNDVRTRARAKAAAGSDARMSGCSLSVVINAGSGNQGITCSVPVIEYANEIGASREKLYRALIISNLVALHIKRFIGRLSAYCGVASAGVAAGAAIAYLYTEDLKIIEKTIGNALMIASGMICDGAKASCAAKIATAVDAGITGFKLAIKNKSFLSGDGLLKDDIEQTIRNMGYVAKEGMKQTDIVVINKMIEK